ncbi:amidohydrolase [Desulfosporosinus sp. HMP52]|uniref:amidohydrolase family protein n=1 Tax=Desulfosporosinus sp. HMP52 TaxID=1487923 RepID=UPI00051FA96C|nr:amidohydrolase family protein [Desulfosporosinus sp. HMP52]KGK88150.1 amidohydrolase [Desulfosporosinus sp. HMP52]
MYISCSAEQSILEIPNDGESLIAGYWSHERGTCSQPILLQWKDGKVKSLKSVNHLEAYPQTSLQWDQYFLIPGWIDAHVHLALDSLDFYQCLENWSQPVLIEDNIKVYLRRYLEKGIVAIRDGGDLPGFSWTAKHKVEEGIWSGPKVISVHEAVGRAGMYGRFLGRGFQNLSEWKEEKSGFFNQGIDQLKVIVTGLIKFDDFNRVGPTQWTVAELKEIVETAHARQALVMAHASGEEGISVAISAGVDSIEHGYYMTSRNLELMKEKNIAWVPTVAPIGNILKYPTNRYSRHELDTLKRILDTHLARIYEAYCLNLRLGVGTDAGAYQVPHGDSFYDEIEWLVQAGIPKLEVFDRATYENAQILGQPELGKLEIGTPMNQLQLVKNFN